MALVRLVMESVGGGRFRTEVGSSQLGGALKLSGFPSNSLLCGDLLGSVGFNFFRSRSDFPCWAPLKRETLVAGGRCGNVALNSRPRRAAIALSPRYYGEMPWLPLPRREESSIFVFFVQDAPAPFRPSCPALFSDLFFFCLEGAPLKLNQARMPFFVTATGHLSRARTLMCFASKKRISQNANPGKVIEFNAKLRLNRCLFLMSMRN